MKVTSLLGKLREDTGSSASGKLRSQGLIPCVITRKDENVNFYAFINDFKTFIYTPDTYVVEISLDGKVYKTLVQETQFDPLSDEVTHVDFLEVADNKEVKTRLPLKMVGNAPGVQAGGRLVTKMRHVKVKGILKDIPEHVDVNISSLVLGKSIKVKDIKTENFEIIQNPSLPVASVIVPRAMRGKGAEGAEEEEMPKEAEAAQEGGEGGDSAD